MASQLKKTVLKFNNTFPEAYSSKQFYSRNEISYVLRGRAEKLLISKIIGLFPQCNIKDEIIVTTYFESVFGHDSPKTYVIRFRQRVDSGVQGKNFIPPKSWLFSGPGNFEVRIRSKNRKNVTKLGTFLLQKKGKDIYALMKLAKKKFHMRHDLTDFITQSNLDLIKATKEDRNNTYLHLITPAILLRIAKLLTPQFTRVNLKKTFELSQPQKVRITIESHPAYYAYPIERRVHEEGPFRTKYKGLLMERPDWLKIEIKTINKSFGKVIEKKLLSTFHNQKIPKDKLTDQPFPQMIIKASRCKGVLINECPGREIEAKANITKRTNIVFLIEKIRNELLKKKNAPYGLSFTDSEIKIRGRAELNRTIIGWKDNKRKWHEVVTIIRLTKNGAVERGYAAILKWKTDNQGNFREVMNRGQKLEFLNRGVNNKQLLKKYNRFIDKKLQIVGVTKKIKYEIIVQDRDGRDFVISLDQCSLYNSSRILQQLEVGYCHTVIANVLHKPTITVDESCANCMNYFIKLLDKFGVKVEKTYFRKIDFIGLTKERL